MLLRKLAGDRTPLPPRPPLKSMLLAAIGGFLAIAVVTGLGDWLGAALTLGSFGASCVLVFGHPDVPFSQPRNVIAGHVTSSCIGLACMHAFGPHGWAAGIAVGGAIAFMMATRTVHPPAGSNPVIVFLTHPGWQFLLLPTLLGAVCLVGIALLYNNLSREARYPKYW